MILRGTKEMEKKSKEEQLGMEGDREEDRNRGRSTIPQRSPVGGNIQRSRHP